GSVVKTGAAIQILSGHNTYSGGTTINGGVLQLGVNDALSSTGPVTVNSGASLDIGTSTQHIGALTLSGGTLAGGTGAALVGNNMTLTSGTIFVPITGVVVNKGGTGTVTDSAPITAFALGVHQGIFDAQGGIQASVGVTNGAQLKARGTVAG